MAASAAPTPAGLSELDQTASLNTILRTLADSDDWREASLDSLSGPLLTQDALSRAAAKEQQQKSGSFARARECEATLPPGFRTKLIEYSYSYANGLAPLFSSAPSRDGSLRTVLDNGER